MRRGGLPPFHRPSRPSGHQASQGCTARGLGRHLLLLLLLLLQWLAPGCFPRRPDVPRWPVGLPVPAAAGSLTLGLQGRPPLRLGRASCRQDAVRGRWGLVTPEPPSHSNDLSSFDIGVFLSPCRHAVRHGKVDQLRWARCRPLCYEVAQVLPRPSMTRAAVSRGSTLWRWAIVSSVQNPRFRIPKRLDQTAHS